jgi:hypothetical protein
MKNRYYSGYLTFSAIFFIFIAFYSAFAINQKYRTGSSHSTSHFNSLKSNLATLYLSHNDFSSPVFRKNISNIFSTDNSLQSLVITGQSGDVEYLYIKNRDILAKQPYFASDFSSHPEYNFNPFFYRIIRETVIIHGNNSFNLEIIYRILDQGEIISLLKVLVLFILVYILVTLFFLVFIPGSSQAQDSLRLKKPESEKTSGNPFANGKLALPDDPQKAPEDEKPVSDLSPKEAELPQKTVRLETLDLTEDTENKDNESAIKQDEETGLGWFEYLYPKLEQEIEKSASFDTDLTFFLVTIDSPDKPGKKELFKKLPEFIHLFFAPRSAFEYNPDSFAVILTDTDLEEGISKINAFILKLKHVSGIESIFAGASSRNGRLITAKRLVQEAETALLKAVSESDSPLIAFRSDPEKFREIISGKY